MRRQVQGFKLNLTYTVIEGDAQGLGGLGRVLGDIAGDLLSAQLRLIAGLGDVAHVKLLTPAGDQGHALVLIDHRAGHRHRRRHPAHRSLENIGGELGRRRGHTGRAAAVGDGVQPDDGEEVDGAAALVLGQAAASTKAAAPPATTTWAIACGS